MNRPGQSGGVGINDAEIGLHTAKIDAGNLSGFGAHGMGDVPVAFDERSNILNCGTTFQERALVIGGEGLALDFFERWRTTMAALIPFGDESGVRAELLHIFLHLLIKPGDQRRDQHDDADAKNHAEDGEGAAELVGPQGVHSLPEIFAVLLRHRIRLAFRSKSFDGIKFSRAHGRKDAEEESDSGGQKQATE